MEAALQQALVDLLASSPWAALVWFVVWSVRKAVPALPGWIKEMVEARRELDAYRAERQRRRLPEARR